MTDSDRKDRAEGQRDEEEAPRGDTLEDASDEAVEEMKRREAGGHAGTGDIG